MTEPLPESVKRTIADLDHYDLAGVLLEPTSMHLRLDFTGVSDNNLDVAVELGRIVHIVMSKSPEDEDGSYPVGDVSLTPLEDGGREVLSVLNYKIFERDGGVFTYPSASMFHFHLDGCIVLDVVCGEYRVYKQLGS